MNKQTSLRPLFALSWRRIRRRPLQYILFLIGVALGVAMMVSIDLANGSASRAFALSADTITGKTTHRIIGGPNGLDEQVYTTLRRDLAVSIAAPVVEGFVQSDQLGGYPLRLIGIDPLAEPPFRNYLNSNSGNGAGPGTITDFLLTPNSITISSGLAETYGLQRGDIVPLLINGRLINSTIINILSTSDTQTAQSLNDILFTDIATAQELLNSAGTISHIDLIITNPADLTQIETILPPDARLETAAAQKNNIQQMTAAFELNLSALSLLALVVGMFLIYNTVNFSLVQRRPLFGILRCLGVTRNQLFKLILTESAILGLIGSLIGALIGIFLGRLMIGLVTQTINDFYFVVNVQDVAINPWSLLKGILIGTSAAIAASLPPALEALQTAPSTTLRRSTIEGRLQRAALWLIPIWAILCIIGALLLAIPGGLAVAFAGLFTILIACALLAPPMTILLLKPLGWLTGTLFGAVGRMAPRDIVRSLSRTSIATAALMTAVSVIIGVSIMIGSFRGTVVSWLNSSLQADIFISPPSLTASRNDGFLAPELIETATNWPGVDYSVTARSVQVPIPDFNKTIHLIGVNGDVSRGERPYAWKSSPDAFERMLAGEGLILSETFVLQENLPMPPPPLTILTPEGAQTFPIIAVYYDYASDRGSALMSQSLYRSLWNDQRINDLGLFTAPGADPEQLTAELKVALADLQNIQIRSNQTLRTSSIAIFDRTFAITAALQLLATVVAFIGVLSALMSLQLERAKELGVLRALGMSVRQLWQLTLLETGLIGFIAAVLAMPTGYVLAWILIYIINVRSFGWTLNLAAEPVYFIQAALVAVTAALLAGIYPCIRLGNMLIAMALREE